MIDRIPIAATLLALLTVFPPGPQLWAQENKASALALEQLTPEFDRSRIKALAEALNFADWPRPEVRFLAPSIDRSLLSEPERITHETQVYSTVAFKDGLWGKLEQSWRSAQKLSPATSVPDSRSERVQVKGGLSVGVVLAPDANAAQEYLLAALANNMLATDGLIASVKAAERPTGLGDVALLLKSRDGNDQRLHFVRNNVYVSVRADGEFAPNILSA